MIRTFIHTVAALGLVVGLGACGEKPQVLSGMPKSDTPPSAGTGVSNFTAPGWQPGDAKSWHEQLKTRAQYGMNDHTRSP
jgi:hypothetical protein